jgi:hypothetical protein
MFREFILLLQSLFCSGGYYTETQYEKAINVQTSQLQAVYQNASVSYNEASKTVTLTTANGSIIVIDPSENN